MAGGASGQAAAPAAAANTQAQQTQRQAQTAAAPAPAPAQATQAAAAPAPAPAPAPAAGNGNTGNNNANNNANNGNNNNANNGQNNANNGQNNANNGQNNGQNAAQSPAAAANNNQNGNNSPTTTTAANVAQQQAVASASLNSSGLVSGSASAASTSVLLASYNSIQAVPTVTAIGDSSGDNSTGGSSNFPVGAIAGISVVCSLVALFAAWRLYLWRNRRNQRHSVAFPAIDDETHERKRNSYTPTSTAPFLGGTQDNYFYPESAGASIRSLKAGPAGRSSLSIDESSMLRSPDSAGAHPGMMHRDSSMSTDQLRQQGARQSVYSLSGLSQMASPSRHSFAGSLYGLSGNHRQSMTGQSTGMRPLPRASTGAPHSMYSRVEISVPQPLAGPPGTIVAHDTTTLDFAPGSGIGNGSLGDLDIGSSAPRSVRQSASREQIKNDRRSSSTSGITAARRAAYLAHGNKASYSSAGPKDFLTGTSSPEDLSSSEENGQRRDRKGPVTQLDRLRHGKHSSTEGSESSGNTRDHDGQYRPPRQHLDEMLGGR